MSAPEFRRFKREALKYKVYKRKLWRLLIKGMLIKLIVDKEEIKAQILREVYNQSGHKRRESTYHRLSQRYFWNSSYKDVKDYIKSCLKCQLRST